MISQRAVWAAACAMVLLATCNLADAQNAPSDSSASAADLKFAVVLTRHGVRSPTGAPEQYASYSSSPWPAWTVPPGYLTAHGYDLMKIFGAYYRARFAEDGLLARTGCEDTAHVTILADSDQRTRETGKALSEGLFPGCTVSVSAKPEGTNDPLFHPRNLEGGQQNSALIASAIAGRIGGNANNLTQAYRPQLEALDRILAGCGRVAATNQKRTSVLDVPATLSPGASNRRAEIRGPVSTASSLAENLLLEYTEGMSGQQLGWGCLDESSLREIMQLHTAAEDFNERTPVVARRYASNLLSRIVDAMEQNVTGKPVPESVAKSGDRLLILVGHDTNIATVAGALGVNWIIDGRRDDTPPGGALLFEIWHMHATGEDAVRVAYVAQTLKQMRESQPLSLANPPDLAPVFVPGCGRQDMSCSFDQFAAVVRRAVAQK